MRTEKEGRVIGNGTNALASSIILVCRKRLTDAPSISRREFIRELNGVLLEALDEMTKGSGDDRSPAAPLAPVAPLSPASEPVRANPFATR